MSDGVMRTVVGRCVDVSERSGWTTFNVEVEGEEYPLRLSTKRPEIVDAGYSAGHSTATWEFQEKEGTKINENTGRPYINRYLEGVVSYAVEGVTASGSEPTHKPLTHGDKDRSITRMAVLKAASELYAGTGDVNGMFYAATRMEVWVYRDIDPLPFDADEPTKQQAPTDADDIPF